MLLLKLDNGDSPGIIQSKQADDSPHEILWAIVGQEGVDGFPLVLVNVVHQQLQRWVRLRLLRLSEEWLEVLLSPPI